MINFMMKKKKHRPFVQKLLLTPFKIGMKVTKLIWRDVPEPGTLILVRHGESEWNVNKTFTVSFYRSFVLYRELGLIHFHISLKIKFEG